jgi:hypothetical protein
MSLLFTSWAITAQAVICRFDRFYINVITIDLKEQTFFLQRQMSRGYNQMADDYSDRFG